MQLASGDAEGMGQREQTRREVFPAEMEQVVPWKRLKRLIEPYCPVGGRPGRQPYPLPTILLVHLQQLWYALSHPSVEEALYDTAVVRELRGNHCSGITWFRLLPVQ